MMQPSELTCCFTFIGRTGCRTMTHSQFCCLVCGVLTPGKLLASPKEALADPLPKHLLFGWSSPVQLLQSP